MSWIQEALAAWDRQSDRERIEADLEAHHQRGEHPPYMMNAAELSEIHKGAHDMGNTKQVRDQFWAQYVAAIAVREAWDSITTPMGAEAANHVILSDKWGEK